VVSRWERAADSPRVDTLVRILRACGYEPDLVLRAPGDDGVDREQIRASLALTPKQRLASSSKQVANRLKDQAQLPRLYALEGEIARGSS
jgi:transcriptional regulator with XRE-family HTH domain